MRWALLALLVPACGGPPELSVCVRTAPDDELFFVPPPTGKRMRAIPFDGPEVVRSVDAGDEEIRLPPLDLGQWVFVLDVLRGETVLATGRTPLVEVASGMDRTPCLYLASVGTFGNAAPPDPSAGHFAVAEAGGTTALVLTDAGLQRYDHLTGELGAERVAPTVGSHAFWVRLPGNRATVIGDGGAEIIDAGVLHQAPGGAMVTDLDGAAGIAVGTDRVLLVGGSSGPDAAPDSQGSVRVVDLETGRVEVLQGTFPVRGARLGLLENGRVIAVGGNSATDLTPLPSDRIALIDPLEGVLAETTLDVPRMGHAVAVVEGNILVFGGTGADGALLSAIERFRLAAGELVHAAPPERMSVPRADLAAIALDEDVLLVGGDAPDAEDAVTAEVFRFALNGTEAADPPGMALPDPAVAVLHDGAVLVVGGGRAVVYRP